MANGDITKETEYDKIEVVGFWNIQVRKATVIMEEQADGSKKEISRGFHRHVLQPFKSVYTPAVIAVDSVTAPCDTFVVTFGRMKTFPDVGIARVPKASTIGR